MSYLHIKQIVEAKIEEVTRPLIIDDDVRRIITEHNIPEDLVQNYLLKENAHLKKYYKHKFSKQVVHQLVQQIVKNEQENIAKVSEQLGKVAQLAHPIIIPEAEGGLSIQQRVCQLQELVEILPEPEYIFLSTEDEESGVVEKPEQIEADEDTLHEEGGLIVDDQVRVESISRRKSEEEYTKAVTKELKGEIESRKASAEELRQTYAKLRQELIEKTEQLIYAQQKAEYLEKLKKDVQFLKQVRKDGGKDVDGRDFGDLEAQITKFRILVEKLEYATG